MKSLALVCRKFPLIPSLGRSLGIHRHHSTSHTQVQPNLSYVNRMNYAPFLIAKHDSDEIWTNNYNYPDLHRLVERASCAFKRNDIEDFILATRLCITELESKKYFDNKHPFALPHNLVFLDKPSPFAYVFEDMIKFVFYKALDANDPWLGFQNGYSGYSISGFQGVGKSNGMRLLSVMMSLLLPRCISVYVDFQANAITPFQALLKASSRAGFIFDDYPDDVASLISALNRQKYVVVFCADEVQNIYQNEKIWSELHAMISGQYTSIFLSGDTDRLFTILKGTDEKLIEKWYPRVMPSLDKGRIKNVILNPLATMKQYDSYFQRRQLSLFSSTKSPDELCLKLNSLTSGSLQKLNGFSNRELCEQLKIVRES